MNPLSCVLANNHINHKVFSICFVFSFQFFLKLLRNIISVTDFPLLCPISARKCLVIPPAQCSLQKKRFFCFRVISNFGDGDCPHAHARNVEETRREGRGASPRNFPRACVYISPAPQSPSPKLDATRSLGFVLPAEFCHSGTHLTVQRVSFITFNFLVKF